MQKYNILFFSLLLFCCSCGNDDVPGGVIDQDKMIGLLTQIHIADGTMYNTMQMPDSLYKYGFNKYEAVLKSFHTDSNQLKKSMRYYTLHPDILEKIYLKISDNLRVKSDSLNKINQAQIEKDNKRRTDSLSKLPKQQQNQAPQPPKQQPTGKPAPHFNNKRYLPPNKSPNAKPIQ